MTRPNNKYHYIAKHEKAVSNTQQHSTMPLWLRIEGRLQSFGDIDLRTMPYDEWMMLYDQVRDQEGRNHIASTPVGRYLWRIDQWKGKAEIHRLKKEHKELLRRHKEMNRRVEATEDLCVADYADC